jgi:hypothetical protein
VRFVFGAPLELSALSSEALRLPEASETGHRSSGHEVIELNEPEWHLLSPTSRVPSVEGLDLGRLLNAEGQSPLVVPTIGE